MNSRKRERLLRLFTSAPDAFWRFDVDVSLNAAEHMARFAQLAGVQASFYLMPRSHDYNLFSREGARTIDAILSYGHRVGMHVDHRSGDPAYQVACDFDLCEAGYPGTFTEDRLVSFHMPRFSVLWRRFDGFANAYAPEWEGRYLSDSRGEWTEAKQALVTDDMQVNLHPIHWMIP